MKIHVAQMLKQTVGLTKEYPVDEPAQADRGPVRGRVKLTRTGRSILVTGRLETAARLACGRCLEEFEAPLSLDVEEEFFPTVDVLTGEPLPAPEDEGAFTIDENHILDLDEAVRQYTILALPMKPICRPDCAGLCPHCGASLNQGLCQCPTTQPDPRWAKLEALRPGAGASRKGV